MRWDHISMKESGCRHLLINLAFSFFFRLSVCVHTKVDVLKQSELEHMISILMSQ